jgi:hypothetical protein
MLDACPKQRHSLISCSYCWPRQQAVWYIKSSYFAPVAGLDLWRSCSWVKPCGVLLEKKRKHRWGSWYRCSASEGKENRKGKKRREVRSKDRRKVPDRPHRRPVQSGKGKGDGEKKGKKSVKDGCRCLLMFGGSVSAHLADSYSLS